MKPTDDLLGQETDLLVLQCFLPQSNLTFIDIGAERGSFSNWLIAQGFSGTAIEPLPKHFDELRKIATSGNLRVLDYAIDVQDGERDFHIATDVNGAVSDYFHSLDPLVGDARVHHTQSIRVQCRSLNSLVQAGQLSARIGVLKIDTEGNDLNVLRSMSDLEAEVVMAEYATPGIYSGWNESAPLGLIAQAESLGYRHCIAVRRNRLGMEQITYQPIAFPDGEWGNLIFVRTTTYPQVRACLELHSLQQQFAMQRKIEDLQSCCDQRLELINRLHTEAEKRLHIIESLSGAKSPVE